MAAKRTYDDPCGVARALDLIGERWALLVVRELIHGPKRFTDLRAGLPLASPNVLSQRLRELEAAEVVHRRKLGPPAGIWVYELTERGYELEPVLLSLADWGSRAPMTSVNELSVDSLMLALKTTFDARRAGGLAAVFDVRLDTDRFRIEIERGRIEVARAAADDADAVIETTPAGLRALVFSGRELDDAIRSGEATIDGDTAAVATLTALFPRPLPV